MSLRFSLKCVPSLVFAGVGLFAFASCAGSGVTPRQSRFGDGGPPIKQREVTPEPEEQPSSEDAAADDTKKEKKKKKKSGFVRTDGGDGGDAEIAYPTFKFNGEGIGPCGDKNYPVVINVTTSYSRDQMQVRKENGRVICSDKYFRDGYPDGECEKRANSAEKLAKRNVTNTFDRLSPSEIQQAKDDGVDIVAYAVFAKSVSVSDGRNLTFSKPLPVGVVPAAKGRYKGMETKSWTANVSGGGAAFDVTVEISMVSSDSGSVDIKMTSTIPQAGDNWGMYEQWVLPSEAIYTIDTDEASITGIQSRSMQAGGGDRCNRNEMGTMRLTLCEKEQGGETESGSCVFGQNPYP